MTRVQNLGGQVSTSLINLNLELEVVLRGLVESKLPRRMNDDV